MRIDSQSLFHPHLLRSFVTVVDEGSFSKAAQWLNSQQPTLSHQITRLEEAVGHRLFDRTTRSIRLTAAGEALLPIARSILISYETARRALDGNVLKGRVRLGASEDFALVRLPAILEHFRQVHEEVELVVTISASAVLEEKLVSRELDLAILECLSGERTGIRLRTDRPEWYALNSYAPARDESLPVVLNAHPSAFRDRTIAALEAASLPWREVCTASSFLGLRAAALAGLGAAPLIPTGDNALLQPVSARFGLPPLPQVDIILVTASETQEVLEFARQCTETYSR